MLNDRIRAIGANVADGHFVRFGGIEIDIVDARGNEPDELQFRRFFYDLAGHADLVDID